MAGAQLSLLRDLINRPEYEAMDCAPLVNWPQAHVACEALARSSNKKALALGLALTLTLTRTRTTRTFSLTLALTLTLTRRA